MVLQCANYCERVGKTGASNASFASECHMLPIRQAGPVVAERLSNMLIAHQRHVSQTKSISCSIVLALGALVLPTARSQSQPAAPVDGPAGYEVACSIQGSKGFHACEDLPSARSCHSESNLASQSSKEATAMTFVNRSNEPVKIYWLSFQGERKLYQYLPPGGRHMQKTFIGHNWLVTNLAEQCIGIFNAAPQSIAFF
jgi:hypothetical protein